MPSQLTSAQLEATYILACRAELQALKPGNVHIFADGHGMVIEDFIKSAEVSAAAISQVNLSVGERIFNAVSATQKAVGINTNLGIILLCAPLIHAALQADVNKTLQQNLCDTLSSLTVKDAQLVAQAIVLANPAGLNQANEHDVHEPLHVNLLETMRSAQSKDRIAWQYANHFADIFEFGLPCYQNSLDQWLNANNKWQNQAWATTALYLGFLARQCDTHVIRKHGKTLAIQVMLEAQEIEAIYLAADNPKLVQKQLLAWDYSLKSRALNPGTSADLTVACLLAKFISN